MQRRRRESTRDILAKIIPVHAASNTPGAKLRKEREREREKRLRKEQTTRALLTTDNHR